MNLRQQDWLDSEIQTAILGLTLGLPSRCECPEPFERPSMTLAATLCDWCGGLVATDRERAEATITNDGGD